MPEQRGGEAAEWLARGDEARDAGRWAEAARAYGAYLELRPDDRGILVQRGHCLKEDGDPEAALALYRRAEALDPSDADIPLQIGHALKRLARGEEAAEAYRVALALDPQGEARAEWSRAVLGLVPPAPRGPVLDLSGLVAAHAEGRTPDELLRAEAAIAAAAGDTPLCALHPAEEAWRALPRALFRRLHELSLQGTPAEDPAWQDAVAVLRAWRRQGAPLKPGAGTVLVTLGSAWDQPGQAAALRAARAAGARHVALLQDCAPLALPEETTPRALRTAFGRWFSTLPVLAEGVVASSRSTAAEFRRLMLRHLPDWPAPPVAVIPPDGRDPKRDRPRPAPRRRAGLALRRPARTAPAGEAPPPGVPAEPFVLLAAASEPRRNATLALAAWRRLLDRRGPAGTPRLVLAGAPGAAEDTLRAALAADPALAARVTRLPAADAGLLEALHRACLFTLHPSRHEGWALPVSESLLHGRVPLVAEIPALAETGGEAALLFAPNDAEDLARLAETLIADPARLEAAEARIPARGGLRPWAEVAEELLSAARRLAAQPPPALPAAPDCQAIPLGHGDLPGPASALTRVEAVLQGPGWHPAEAWGRWTRPGRAALLLQAPSDGPARIALGLRLPPGPRPALRVTVTREGAAPLRSLATAAGPGDLVLEVGAGGPALHILLETAQAAALPDGRQVGIGLASAATMRADRPADRIAYLESRILVPALPG